MEQPETIAIMPLGQIVFFPHMLLPLHIFEPRYRQMLSDSLANSRMFAVTAINPANSQPAPVGTVGLIRACIKKGDGTANLLLQGLYRARFSPIAHSPCLLAKAAPLNQRKPANPHIASQLAGEIISIVNHSPELCPCRQFPQELASIADYNALVDILAGNLIHCTRQKQQLLECEDTTARLAMLATSLRAEYAHH